MRTEDNKIKTKSIDNTGKEFYQKINNTPLPDENNIQQKNIEPDDYDPDDYCEDFDKLRKIKIRKQYNEIKKSQQSIKQELQQYLGKNIGESHIIIGDNIKIYTNRIFPEAFKLLYNLSEYNWWITQEKSTQKEKSQKICIEIATIT